MWAELKSIADNMNSGWLVGGDFIDISEVAEKRGGVQASRRHCNLFHERFKACNLMVLEL